MGLSTLISRAVSRVMPAARATGLLRSICRIQQPDTSITPNGSPSGGFVDVSGLTAIACMDAPESENRIQATEIKELAEIMAKGLRHVLLDSYYPQLDNAAGLGWRALIDGVAYDLLGGEKDSQRTQTRLNLQLVDVGVAS